MTTAEQGRWKRKRRRRKHKRKDKKRLTARRARATVRAGEWDDNMRKMKMRLNGQ